MNNEIPILFESPDFVVVDKASGLSVHNNEDPENLLIVLEKQLRLKKFFPVHRLDKETSGVQILALNEASAKRLADEFQKRSVGKIYNGILRGELKIAKGLWAKPLSDKAEGRRSPAGLPKDRVACETGFHITQSSRYFTLCEFQLLTGRQHQIRKHCALAGHALVGDPRYGEPKYNAMIADRYKNPRMFLHCASVALLGQTFASPLPNEFAAILAPS